MSRYEVSRYELALAFMRASDLLRVHQRAGLPIPLGMDTQLMWLRAEFDQQPVPLRRPS